MPGTHRRLIIAIGEPSLPLPWDSGCTPQFQDLQNDPSLVMACRALVLDDDTINQICKDPVKCQQYFNSTRSAFFCARGSGPDAGT